MAKQRYVDTRFWHDNFVREKLNPLDRYLFLYFLTNDKTNIAGFYELPLSIIASETGLEKEMIDKMMKRLRGKIEYYEGWIWIRNFVKYQNMDNLKIKTGVNVEIGKIPDEIKQKIGYLYPTYDLSHSNPNSNLNSNTNTNSNTATPRDVVNHFFELKGWANKNKEFYSKNKIIYSRFVRPAKDLLELCDGNIDEANGCLDKLSGWAKSRDLDWGIETVFKKWYDIDNLKPKEKKPYIDGMRAFQKTDGGKWYVVNKNGEIKEYGAIPKEIIYK